MRTAVMWTVGLLALLLALIVLDRLALWMESRGWIYWRKSKHRTGGTLGNAFLEIQSMVDPGKRIVLEERRRSEAAEDESDSGDPPEPGRQGHPIRPGNP